MQTAIRIRREKKESKRREDERQRRAQERAQLQKDIQAEEQRLEQFDKSVECWERADLTCFIQCAVKRRWSTAGGNPARELVRSTR
jgi:hypothetical protein